MRFFSLYLFLFLYCFGNAQTVALKKIGTYKWVKNKNNGPLINGTYTVRTKKVVKTEIKKRSPDTPHRKISLRKSVLRNYPIKLKKQTIKFTGKPIKVNQKQTASQFIFRDNAKGNITYTDKSHGFVGSNSFDIKEDNEHNMWIASEEGIIKYDGLRYYLYNSESGLPKAIPQELFFDKLQRLWVVTDQGFYYVKNDSCFLPDVAVFKNALFHDHSIAADSKNNIWISSVNCGIIGIYTDNKYSIIDKEFGLQSNYVFSVSFDERDNLYISQSGFGFLIAEPNKLTSYQIIDSDKTETTPTFVFAKNDTIYAGAWDKGLVQITKYDTLIYSVTGAYKERILKIISAPTGIFYSAYGTGAVHFKNGQSILYSTENGLVNKSTRSLFFDSFKNLWVCDGITGISRVNENIFLQTQNYNTLKGLMNIRNSSDKKNKWLFFNGECVTQETDTSYIRYDIINPEVNISLKYVFDGYVNNKNEVWGASYANSGICKIENDMAHFYFFPPTAVLIVNSTLNANDTMLWFATEHVGLMACNLKTNQFYQKNVSNGTLSNNVLSLKKTGLNELVCLYNTGLQKIDNSDLYDFYINDSLVTFGVTNVMKFNGNKTLLSTDTKGLLLLDGKEVYSLNSGLGLTSDNIKNIFLYNDKLWIITDKGIDRVILNKQQATFDRYFDSNFGMFINKMSGLHSITNDNRLLFYANDVYEYRPEYEIKNENQPIIKIFQISTNNITLKNFNNIEIQPTKKLHINYNIINWGHENEYKQMALIVSQNNDTALFQIGEPGSITISELSPGDYTLKILLQKHRKNYYSTPINFTVLQYWYNTWWFRFFIFFSTIVLFIYLYKRKQAQNVKLENKVKEQTEILRKEKIALEEKNAIINIQNLEKDALIQEVHHRVKNNLQFIAAMLKMQINSIKDENNQAVLKETSRRINSMSLVHEMLYNKEKLEVVSAKDYLTELVSKLKELVYDDQQLITFNLSIEDVTFNINNCVAIGMITSEIISNAIKYAFANTSNPIITITLNYNSINKEISYSIQDNGVGLISKTKQGGLGMRLIDIFARQMEAEYDCKNENGLKYIFIIPYDKYAK